jgi:hypothetical protein
MLALQMLIIQPVSIYFANKHLHSLNLRVYSSGNVTYDKLPLDEKSKVDEIVTRYYIATDVIILGLAGLLAGLLFGIYFIGVSFEKKGWPGMAAFIILSLIGSGMFSI